MSTTKVQGDMIDVDGATVAVVAAGDKFNFLDISDSLVKEDTVQGILDLGGGGWQFVSLVTASDDATVAFTGLESGYDHLVTISEYLPATDNAEFDFVVGITGPTYRTSLYIGVTSVQATSGSDNGVSTDNMRISTGQSNAAGEELTGNLFISGAADAGTETHMEYIGQGQSNASLQCATIACFMYTTPEAHTAIKFAANTGNMATGEFRLYKRANA
jgi:hypothetical protein